MNFAKCDYDLYFLADIKLESETEETTDFSDITLPPNVYHPKHALMTALKVMTLFFLYKSTFFNHFNFLCRNGYPNSVGKKPFGGQWANLK